MNQPAALSAKASKASESTIFKILIIIGVCHLLNDAIQAVVPAMFPILEKSMGLTFTQLGIIAFSLNMVSSVMQPVVGFLQTRSPCPLPCQSGLPLHYLAS